MAIGTLITLQHVIVLLHQAIPDMKAPTVDQTSTHVSSINITTNDRTMPSPQLMPRIKKINDIYQPSHYIYIYTYIVLVQITS